MITMPSIYCIFFNLLSGSLTSFQNQSITRLCSKKDKMLAKIYCKMLFVEKLWQSPSFIDRWLLVHPKIISCVSFDWYVSHEIIWHKSNYNTFNIYDFFPLFNISFYFRTITNQQWNVWISKNCLACMVVCL